MSFLEADYTPITPVDQWDGDTLVFPKDGKPSSAAYNLTIWQRIANSLKWLKGHTVQTTGNHTMSGHLSVPTPTADAHAATKAYVDATLGGISATPGDPGGPPAGTAASGYVKHLNGMMEAWVRSDYELPATAEAYSIPLPVTFNSILNIQITTQPQTESTFADSMYQLASYTNNSVSVYHNDMQEGDSVAIRAWVRVLGTWN